MKSKTQRVKMKGMDTKKKNRALYGLVNNLKYDKEQAYLERNNLVAFLSKIFPSYLGTHEKEDLTWDRAWLNIVYIETPEGQLSWHFHVSLLHLFSHLEHREGNHWDGHTTEEKYERLGRLSKSSIT